MRNLMIASALLMGFFASGAKPAQAADIYACPHLQDKTRQSIEEMTQGKEGWFFRVSSDMREDFQLFDETQTYFKRMADAFAKQGTTLVFMPIPTRPMSAYRAFDTSKRVQAEYDVESANQSFDAMVASIRKTGVIVPDLRATIDEYGKKGKDFFFKRDQHWRPEGAHITAEYVTRELAGNAKYKNSAKSQYKTTGVGNFGLKDNMGAEIQRLCTSPTDPEPYVLYETKMVTGNDASALFGEEDEAAPSVLLGSSFSALPKFNFDGFLMDETGLKIANHSISAGLRYNAIISYTASRISQKGKKPPFVFWETPASYAPNEQVSEMFRQVIPAIGGECSASEAVATGKASVSRGAAKKILSVAPEKKVNGPGYFLFIDSSNRGIAKFTLTMEYDDGDGEWFTVDRSEHFNNEGRFFIELSDDIDSNLLSVAIDGMAKLDTDLNVRLCKVK